MDEGAPLKTCFIVNPRSGTSAGAIGPVREFAAQHGAAVRMTERARHAAELATQALADGFDLIVAVGGDGTLNEVAATLVGTSATFGLVPCGSGNGLGRHLGIHGEAEHALRILAHGQPRLIDSGVADGHPFFTAAGLGFEAEISRRFNLPGQRGLIGYLMRSAEGLREWKPLECTIEYDGQRETLSVFTLVVANSDQYGNNAMIAPGARVDDGLLDLTVIPPVTPANALPLLQRLFAGTLGREAGVVRRRGARFVVEVAGVEPGRGLLQTDGEVHECGARVEFEVRPGSLRIMAPA